MATSYLLNNNDIFLVFIYYINQILALYLIRLCFSQIPCIYTHIGHVSAEVKYIKISPNKFYVGALKLIQEYFKAI